MTHGTGKQAQTAGSNAASQFKDGKMSEEDFFAQLRQHENDPDWQTGAMRELGQEGLWDIKEDGVPPDPNSDSSTSTNMKALSMAVAAAMTSGVTFPDPEDGEKGNEDITLLAPMLQYADFPPKVLATLGKESMAPGNYVYGQQVWNALAKSPQGSAIFIQQNASYIVPWVEEGDHRGGLPDDQLDAFTKVLQAGTVGIKGTDPKLGGQAVTALLKASNANSGKHMPTQIDAVYGNIVKAYWPDVMFALTSKASGSDPKGLLTSPDGMKLTSSDWAPFIQEAMRDPKTSADLLAQAHTQGAEWQNEGSKLPGGRDAGDSFTFDAGVVEGFFDYQAKQTYTELKKEDESNAEDWKESVSKWAGVASGLTVDIVADPGEGIVKPSPRKSPRRSSRT